MNKFFVNVLLLLVTQVSFGQGNAIIAQLNDRIDELQYELDAKDGTTDGFITSSSNNYAAQRGQQLYMDTVNRLQREITDKDQEWTLTRNELRELKNWLVDTDPAYYLDGYYLDQFDFFYKLNTNASDAELVTLLHKQPNLAVRHYSKFKKKPFAEQIIQVIYKRDPDLIVNNANRLKESPYASKITKVVLKRRVDKIAEMQQKAAYERLETPQAIAHQIKKNPIKMKRWVGTNTIQSNLIEQSNDSAVKTFLTLYNLYGRASKSYYFLNDLLAGTLTPEEAEAIGNDDEKFRNYLIEYSIRPGSIIGNEAIQEQLQVEALNVVRPINDLHENHNDALRFKSANSLNEKQLYTYMVYTQQEIFTSTYNGFYKRFMKKLGKKNPYEFLEEMNFNKYRTFIKMNAGFGTLDEFLSKMEPEQRKTLLTKFVSNLEEGTVEESLTASVNVADTFGSIENEEMKDFFKEKIKSELARVKSEYNQHGIKIYSLLDGILAQSDNYSEDWMKGLTETYNIPKINQLEIETLLNHEGKIIQQVYFFDDDDGKASYNSFMPSFRNSKWTIKDKKSYVHIISKNKKVEIFANKPTSEFEGPEQIKVAMQARGIEPSVVIHRGHSFYVDTTIKNLTPNTKLVLLGSCGGYHNLSEVLKQSEFVHIISSKQIGSMSVNDPMIRLLNKNMVNQEDIQWQPFWKTLGNQLKGNRNFKDYIPPHQNLGAIFIMAYNRMN